MLSTPTLAMEGQTEVKDETAVTDVGQNQLHLELGIFVKGVVRGTCT